ncbi:MAG: arsenate reductase [Acidimicrobiia bacterium]|nr:arsenate reductase [Acidimicrobiia bacterium]
MTTIIYHNPKCSTSRKVLDAATEADAEIDVRRYLDDPPDRATLEAIIGVLEDPVADLVRKDPFFKGLELDPADYTEADAVIELLLEHPRLLQRPLLVRSDAAIIGRPPERASAFLVS